MIIASRPALQTIQRFVFLPTIYLLASPAFPWGCQGHRVIALIAADQLTSHAQSASARLLSEYSSDPSLRPFCGSSDLPAFAQMSTWADDIRSRRKETAPWHFIDIPLDAGRGQLGESCPSSTGCITSAIQSQLDILRSSAGDQKKAEALVFVIHLAGDLHQPLHAASNNDRGGNCLPVAFLGQEPRESAGASFKPNLHSVWDIDLVDHIIQDQDLRAFAGALKREFSDDIGAWKRSEANLEDWAWESHEAAVKVSYGALPRKIPVETPRTLETCADDDHVSTRLYDLHEKVDESYFRVAAPLIRRQLALAGTRLALLLNQIWP